ncbi:MAG TPA: cytochrome C oxidase subunit IV family protein [Chitinivibrionales bacterium]|nr:cytochrome C oxidase subunit IV family protein [Chitinivibrionales bacterium]
MENQQVSLASRGLLKETGLRGLIGVWAALIAFTALTVAVAGLNLQKIAVVVCLAIAAVKSTLVIFYFMQLWYERRLIIRLIVPIAMITLAIFIGLTFSDVFTR